MTRRNPPSPRAAHRERRAFDRRTPFQKRFGPPDAATLLRMREELYARRGHSPIVTPETIAHARRHGLWAGEVDLREVDDGEIAYLWREHRWEAEHGRAPMSAEVVPRMLGCSPEHARAVARELAAREREEERGPA